MQMTGAKSGFETIWILAIIKWQCILLFFGGSCHFSTLFSPPYLYKYLRRATTNAQGLGVVRDMGKERLQRTNLAPGVLDLLICFGIERRGTWSRGLELFDALGTSALSVPARCWELLGSLRKLCAISPVRAPESKINDYHTPRIRHPTCWGVRTPTLGQKGWRK